MTDFSKLVLPRKHLKNEMVISCTVSGCHSSRLNSSDLSFCRLPKDSSYRATWLHKRLRKVQQRFPPRQELLLVFTAFQFKLKISKDI